MKRIFSLLLVCMMLLASVAMAEEAAVADNVIAVVDGVTILAEEAQDEYDYYLEYYASYGITDEASLGQLRSDLISMYVQDVVVENKVAELGIVMPTEEEIAQQAEKEYEETSFELLTTYPTEFYTGEGDVEAAVAAFMELRAANPDMKVREAIDAMEAEEKTVMEETMAGLEAYYAEAGYEMDQLKNYWRQNLSTMAVYDYIASGLEITEEDVKAYFDELIAAEEASYAEDPGALESMVASGQITGDPMYVPEGYRYIEHILVLMDSADQNSMYVQSTNLAGYETSIAEMEGVEPMDGETHAALKNRKSEIELRMTEIDGLLQNEEADIDALTEERGALETELGEVDGKLAGDDAKLYTYMQGKADAETKIAAIKEKYQAKIDDIYARLEAGEDFTALVLELGEDPGMLNETQDAVVPYMVYEKTEGVWEENFAAAAVALAEGEYSQEAVWTTYGAHIIMNKGAVPAGAVAYEDVRETMAEEYSDVRKAEAYGQTIEAWIAEADVETYPDNLKSSTAETEAE